jgi:hypothetical protein
MGRHNAGAGMIRQPPGYMPSALIELPALFSSGISCKRISKQSCCYFISAAISTRTALYAAGIATATNDHGSS